MAQTEEKQEKSLLETISNIGALESELLENEEVKSETEEVVEETQPETVEEASTFKVWGEDDDKDAEDSDEDSDEVISEPGYNEEEDEDEEDDTEEAYGMKDDDESPSDEDSEDEVETDDVEVSADDAEEDMEDEVEDEVTDEDDDDEEESDVEDSAEDEEDMEEAEDMDEAVHGKKDMEEAEDMDEELNLEEILAELELEEKKDMDEMKDMDEEMDMKMDDDAEINLEDMSEDELKTMIEDVIEDMIEDGELVPGPNADESEEEEAEDTDDGMEGDADVDIEVDDIDLQEGKEKMDEVDLSGSVQAIPDVAAMISFLAGALGVPAIALASMSLGDLKNMLMKTMGGGRMAMGMEEGEKEKMEETIQTLRADLNEVNLLNSKLLYTNKIFRGKNLPENQKIFETLNENLVAKTKKSNIRESMGAASKPAGVAPKRLTENVVQEDAMVNRFKQLAGIK